MEATESARNDNCREEGPVKVMKRRLKTEMIKVEPKRDHLEKAREHHGHHHTAAGRYNTAKGGQSSKGAN